MRSKMLPFQSILFLVTAHFSFSQSSLLRHIESPEDWSLYAKAGINYQLPTGKGVTNFKDEIANMTFSGQEIMRTSSDGEGIAGLVIGVWAGVFQSDETEAGFGLQYTRRGYDLEAGIQLSDPEYQRDDYFRYVTEVRCSVIEFPIWARYEWKPGLRLGGGFIAGFPLKGSSKATSTITYHVYLNGERDEEYSLPEENESVDIKEETKGFYPGLFVEVSYALFYNITANASIQYAGALTDYPEGKVSSFNGLLMLSYQLK